MKLYFKRENTESPLGIGFIYLEFENDCAIRQVEIYGDQYLSSYNKDYHPGHGPALCDQPLSEIELGSEYQISPEEFELVWNEAVRRDSLT